MFTPTIDFARSYASIHPVLAYELADAAVPLDESEMVFTERVGILRNDRGVGAHAIPAHGLIASNERLQRIHINGFRAEFAVAKFFGFTLQDKHYYDDDDAFGYGARSTTYNSGHLIVYDNDPDSHPIILVIDRGAVQILRGWPFAFEGKGKPSRSPYGRPGSWNKQHELRSIAKLPDLIGDL